MARFLVGLVIGATATVWVAVALDIADHGTWPFLLVAFVVAGGIVLQVLGVATPLGSGLVIGALGMLLAGWIFISLLVASIGYS